MKTLTQYREDIKGLREKIGNVKAKCTAENRDPMPEEVTHMNDLLQDIEELEKIATTMDREERINARLEAPTNPPVSQPKPHRTGIPDRPQDRFGSAGEQFMAIRNAGMPGGLVDPRLRNIVGAASGLNESVPSDGGLI